MIPDSAAGVAFVAVGLSALALAGLTLLGAIVVDACRRPGR